MSVENKLTRIKNREEKRTIIGLMDILEHNFGFNFNLSQEGTVIEVQMVSAGLVHIPRGLTRLKNLYKLQLQSNKIKRLRNLEKCTSIRVINLSDNQIRSDQLKYLSSLSKLRSVDLAYNKITSIKTLGNLSNIESITIHNNKIEKIPKFPNLSKLKFLNLCNNKITKLQNIHVLESLLQLKLKNNPLGQKDQEILRKGTEEIKKYCRNISDKKKE